MAKAYYLDMCIWRDFFEGRYGRRGKPLGSYAADLIISILKNKEIILFSDLNIKEIKGVFPPSEIEKMFQLLFLIGTLNKIYAEEKDYHEAEKIAATRKIPMPDVLHAIIARNNHAVLVTRDRHYLCLNDIADIKKPEEI